MAADSSHGAVILQKASGNVQRHVGAIDHAFEQHQEFGDDLLNIIGYKDLVVIQLNLSLNAFRILRQLGEVDDAL